MKLIRAGLTMVVFWSWMVNARTSSFIARILAWSKNGLTLRSGRLNNMLPPIPFLRTGVACCLPTCAQGSSVSVTELVGKGAAWGLLVLILGVLALLIYPLVCVEPGLRKRAYNWTRSSGGVRRGHCLLGSLGVHQITGKCATTHDGIICSTGCCWKLLYMQVLVRLPSLHDNYAYMVSWNQRALR